MREIQEFTGISAPYEEPQNPELMIDTSELDLQQSLDAVIKLLENKKIID